MDQYQAEDDARTLARAQTIKQDPDRIAAAAKVADRLHKEKMDEARGFKNIARKAK